MEKVKKNQKASWWGWKRRVKKLAWSLTLKNKDDGIWSNHFMANRRGKSRNSDNFYFLGLQNHCGQWLQQWNSKTLAPSKESYDKPVLYLVTQSCPTLCNPMDCRPPGSTVHGILPARILEWVALLQRRDQTQVSCTSGRFFTIWATREALDSILKSRDITLPTKVHIVKTMVYSSSHVQMWELDHKEKVEQQRIDGFELWCWRRLFRVSWTTRRSNQSILKEINSEYSLEGLTLRLKLQYFGHLTQRADSLWKRPWCWERLKATGEEGGRGWDD